MYLFAYNVINIDESKVVVEKDRLYITTTNGETFVIYFEDIIKIEHTGAWLCKTGSSEENYILLKTTYGRYHLKILPERRVTIKEALKERFSLKRLISLVPQSTIVQEERCATFISKVNKEYRRFNNR